MRNILVIAAHPDDEVLGMGGYIAKAVSNGEKVHLLIVTDGSSAQYANSNELTKIIESKRAETKEAARILGISSIMYGDLPDMKLDTVAHIEINKVIEKAIETVKPDVVFTHFWGDVNKDHQKVYESTLVAVRPVPGQIVKEVYCYNVPSSTEWSPCISKTMFMPNYFVDISDVSEKKYTALSAYKTELRSGLHPRNVESVKSLDRAVGLKCGKKECEEFVLIRKVW